MIRRDFLPGYTPAPPPPEKENVCGIPISEPQLRKLYNSLGPDSKSDLISLEKVIGYYKSLDDCGVPYSDAEQRQRVMRHVNSTDGFIGFDEFSCIMLSLVQR